MDRHQNRVFGSLIIFFGIILILDYYHFISFDIWSLWPLLLVFLGYRAERDYFEGKAGSRNLLVAAVLTLYGGYFMLDELPFMPSVITDKFWPIFIIAPGLGFLQMYYFGHHPKRNFKKGVSLTTIGLIFLIQEFITLHIKLFLYVALILFGIYLLSQNANRRDTSPTELGAQHQRRGNTTAKSEYEDGERY